MCTDRNVEQAASIFLDKHYLCDGGTMKGTATDFRFVVTMTTITAVHVHPQGHVYGTK